MARPVRGKPQTDMSRLRRHAMNTLGVIMTDDMKTSQVYRSDKLDVLDQYFEGAQYDDLQDWEEAVKAEEFVPVRSRKPRIIYNLPKAIVNKVAAKLVGSSTFPNFIIEDEEDDTDFFRTVQKACKFRRALMKPVKDCLKSGSCFVRYYIVNGSIKIEGFNSKYCYPKFDQVGELEAIEVKYVYDDAQDTDGKGNPKKKWYRLELNKQSDILYDNPEYRPGVRPTFEVAAQADHGLGWVQGEWFVTDEDKFNFDGLSVFGDILDFCDELNYSLSQTSQCVAYNQEPQTVVNGMDEDEINALIRSSQKAWNLGREGEAKLMESTGKGMEVAGDFRDRVRNMALDVARVVMADPENTKTGQAISGEALKQLYAPLIELVDELRAVLEPHMTNLLIKIAITCLHFNAMGEETVIETPDGYMPSSLDITVQWPPIFPPTLQDILTVAQACTALSQGKIISRESLTRWVAQMIPSVDNIDEELAKIASEPDLNPFGSFDSGGGM